MSTLESASVAPTTAGTPAPNLYLARQPIFDARRQVQGYELLHRSSDTGAFTPLDGHLATLGVINFSVLVQGLQSVTAGKPAYVNFSRETLLSDHADLLPPESTVIEILEDVELDDAIVRRCRDLKRRGFTLALDDVICAQRGAELHGLVDIVKADLLSSPPAVWAEVAHTHRGVGVTLLAEKVETEDVFTTAVELGYGLFQGYFFSKPVMLTSTNMAPSQLSALRLLQELLQPDLDVDAIAPIIASDVALSYKLLALLNSASFGLRHRITEIRQAALLLGATGLRSWASVALLGSMVEGEVPELLVTSLVRAKFCELLSSVTRFAHRKSELFLLGLFSLLDAILRRPFEEILSQLYVAEDIKDALLGAASDVATVYDLVLHYERGDWVRADEARCQLGIDAQQVGASYATALQTATCLAV